MLYDSGRLLFIALVAVVLSCVAAWIVADRYCQAIQRLMQARGGEASPDARQEPEPIAPIPLPPPSVVSLADNRRSGLWLSAALIALSCLLAASSATIWMRLAFPGEPFAPMRAVAVAVLHLWPTIPALGLLWRWSPRRVVGTLVAWCGLAFVFLLWRSVEPRPLPLLFALASEIGPTLALVALLLMGSATRSIAPWLVLPFAGLTWASVAGMDLLQLLIDRRSAGFLRVLSWAGDTWASATVALLAFVALPWLIAWWPLRQLGRALGRAYARKHLSELAVVFATVWALTLTEKAITVSGSAGGGRGGDARPAVVDPARPRREPPCVAAERPPAHTAGPPRVSARPADAKGVRRRRRALAPERQHGADCGHRPGGPHH